VLIDSYLQDAIEVDVDALCDRETVHVAGILEHIEVAGSHSGDSACSLPPYSLPPAVIADIKRQTADLAKALGVVGLMNVQYAVKDDTVYVLEVNPRASRTVPFVAKAIGQPIAKYAARIMAGEKLADLPPIDWRIDYMTVKEAVFPFNRFPGVDTVLGPEMKSTGEVMGLDTSYAIAFAKSQIGSGSKVPLEGTVFISVRDADKPAVVEPMRQLEAAGFKILATGGTQRFLVENGVAAERINKVLEGRPHIVDSMKNGGVQLVINTTDGAKSISDSRDIRRTALQRKLPYYTTIQGAVAAVEGIIAYREGNLSVRPLQDYFRP
jgi:carbamoyl-phosphate synthase large subunit